MTLDRPWGELASVPRYARQLEEWGYDHIWCPDERFERNPYAVLTLAAQATKRAKLGVSVTNPYTRHPLITGAAVATVNEASGGRAVLGLGAGASALFERQGIKRPSSPVTAIREAVELLRPFMRGERVDYGGGTHSFTGADIDFESRTVPIYIAARGPRLLRLAGEVADGVIIGSLTSEGGLEYALENVRLGLERSDRSFSEFEVVLWAYTAIHEDETEARGRVRQLVVSSMWSSRGIIGHLGLDEDDWRTLEEEMSMGFRRGLPPDQVYSSAAVKLSPELIDAWSLAGDVESVAMRARAARDAGVDQIAVLTPGESREERMETQRAFAEGVIGRD
ncbi:MAG: LLM class flavin-dependent oxidoreductase [Candidatus Bathyarchaeota archaeon]|nr:LLM class flavin-dependent oxidoreductase [Candidatus Bathyarchaeota archaeon]